MIKNIFHLPNVFSHKSFITLTESYSRKNKDLNDLQERADEGKEDEEKSKI
jgi:hypothetical protein